MLVLYMLTPDSTAEIEISSFWCLLASSMLFLRLIFFEILFLRFLFLVLESYLFSYVVDCLETTNTVD